MLPLRRITLEANNISFDCYMSGTHGPWVLFLHGFPDNNRSMLALMRDVAIHGYRCLAPNMRGYGRSQGNDDEMTYLVGDLSADVIALARTVSDEPVHVVGHDWGALAAYGAAALSPESIASLTAMAIPPMLTCNRNALRNLDQLGRSWYIGYVQLPEIPEREIPKDDFVWLRDLWESWSPGWSIPERHFDSVVKTFEMGDTLKNALSYYRSLRPFHRGASIARWAASWSLLFRPIQVPGLVISGTQDGCIKAELFDGAEEAFAVEGELYRVEGAGHFMHLEKHAEVSASVRRWIESHPANVA